MGRQLASYDNIAYSYNESGIRTSKTVGENTTEFYLNGTNIIYQTDGTNDIYFFYDRNNELVGFKYENSNYFYVKNQMGDITDIANSNGEVVASYTYDPWGKVTSVSGSNLVIANLNPFRYRSYYYDSDIQMYYLQSRYYDPEVGRFINCDDVNYIGLTESSVSYNPFAYCENEPVNWFDETGFLSSIVVAKIILNIAGYIFAWAYTKYRIRKDYRWRYTDMLDLIAAIVAGLVSAFIGRYVTGAIRKFAVAIGVGVRFYVYSMIWSGPPKNLKQVWKSTKEVIFNALF